MRKKYNSESMNKHESILFSPNSHCSLKARISVLDLAKMELLLIVNLCGAVLVL